MGINLSPSVSVLSYALSLMPLTCIISGSLDTAGSLTGSLFITGTASLVSSHSLPPVDAILSVLSVFLQAANAKAIATAAVNDKILFIKTTVNNHTTNK